MGDSPSLGAAAHADREIGKHLLHQQKGSPNCVSGKLLFDLFDLIEGELHGGLTFEDGQQDLQTLGFRHDLGDHCAHGGECTIGNGDDLANLELSVDFLNGSGSALFLRQQPRVRSGSAA